MYIVSFFTESGVPKTGLSATIKAREIPSGTIVINNEAMVEIGDGFYYYNYTNYDYTKDYAIVSDGSGTLANTERYQAAGNENYVEDIDSVITANAMLKRMVGLMHENMLIDTPVYDDDENLVSARVRIFPTKVDLQAGTNSLGTYTITSVGDGPGKFSAWQQVKE
jgi:hypothetical protein